MKIARVQLRFFPIAVLIGRLASKSDMVFHVPSLHEDVFFASNADKVQPWEVYKSSAGAPTRDGLSGAIS